jgi:hypothetical protein
MTTQPALDPRKSPWRRGDVVTRGFKQVGFVTEYTALYLEVRWNKEGNEGDAKIERIPISEVDALVRVGHADQRTPGDNPTTNLDSLETIESLERIRDAIATRMKAINTDEERREANALVKRIFRANKCAFDERNEYRLLVSLTNPENVGLLFKAQDWLHQMFCKKHV